MWHLREAIRSLYASKQRTVLALIGIVIGIGAVIAMMTITQIAQEQALSEFKALGTDLLNISSIFHESENGQLEMPKIKLDDALALPQKTTTLQRVAPFISDGHFINFQGAIDYVNILGVTDEYNYLNKLTTSQGRLLTPLDKQHYFCVLGADIAQQLLSAEKTVPWPFNRQSPVLVGQRLKIGDKLFTIIGVLKPGVSQSILPYQTDQTILIPIKTALRFFDNAEINNIIARMKPDVDYHLAIEEIKTYFRPRVPDLQLIITAAEDIIEHIEKQMQLFALLSWAVSSIALLVGGIGVMNVMLASVTERKVEIGIRRALGAKRSDIQLQFLSESILLSLVGGCIGILLGMAITYAVSQYNAWPFIVSYPALLLGVGVSSIVGAFFGFYPAYQAAQSDPITALRAK